MNTLILGLGNPLLGDDGVGWRVAEEVARHIGADNHPPLQAEVDFHAGGGLSLMERVAGYDRAIIIDAVQLGQGPTGSVVSFPLAELPSPCAGHLVSAHETDLQTALQLGLKMGMHLPERIMIVAVESPHVYEFSESLTPPVAEAVPVAVQQVLALLQAE